MLNFTQKVNVEDVDYVNFVLVGNKMYNKYVLIVNAREVDIDEDDKRININYLPESRKRQLLKMYLILQCFKIKLF